MEDQQSNAEVAMNRELLCPICLALLHRPSILDQCQHRFCAPCLIRLDRAGIQTCPVCRSDFEDWQLDEGNISPKVKRINILTKYAFFSELQNSLANEYQDVYIRRQQDEDSGIYEPYEPLWFLNLAMVILMTLIQYGIIIMLYFIQITTGDRRDDGIIYEGLVPMIRVLTIIAMAILGLAGYFRW